MANWKSGSLLMAEFMPIAKVIKPTIEMDKK
jgi:hypothetical protein